MTLIWFLAVFWAVALSLFIFVGIAMLLRATMQQWIEMRMSERDFLDAVAWALVACILIAFFIR